ncbi:ABC transporter ATP-binding protein [Paraliobacillus sp. JSM ZJ581]|uniref:ABC transporter ATP-binding protein n=1 Tax=Paraliobacillus sp. JSM ZJ581 TaxID=3342118 RepID=UPI0035A87D29
MFVENEDILVVKNLCKEINGETIINDLSFNVSKGQIFGFLGPNGSGKTTTIRMITGMIKPSSGFVEIMGYNVQTNFSESMRNLSAIVEHPALFDYMTGWQNLIQSVRLLDKKVDPTYIKWCIETVDLSDRIHDKVKNYSLGMKQRLAIAQSLLASPKILILDEPTNGMDPSGIKDIRALIKNLSDEHKITIFLSSHLLSEIENICDEILIINKGKQIVSGSVKDLVNQNTSKFHLTVDPLKLEFAYQLIKQQVSNIYLEDSKIIIHSKKEEIPHLVNHLYAKGIFVYLINHEEYTLEDYFLSVIQGAV